MFNIHSSSFNATIRADKVFSWGLREIQMMYTYDAHFSYLSYSNSNRNIGKLIGSIEID